MTAGQSREVDPDLLADYVGGALAGTPDEDVVARLIVDDPAWAQAHDSLVADMQWVGQELAAWGAELPMPPEVTDRLTAALAAAAPLVPASPDRAAGRAEPTTDPPAPKFGLPAQSRRPLSAVPSTGPVPPGRDGRTRPRRRRWLRWAGPVAVATGVIAFAGFSVPQLIVGSSVRDADSSTAREATTAAPLSAGPSVLAVAPSSDGSAGPESLAVVPAASLITASGTDYSRETVVTIGRTLRTDKAPHAVPDHGGPVVPGLDRLAGADALAACLNAVAAVHGRGTISVDGVDYAAFEGVPALVITFTDRAGERWVWVAGTACGVASDPDTRYRTRLG